MRHVIKAVPFTGSRSKSRGAVGIGMAAVVAVLLVMVVGASAAFASEWKATSWPISFEGKGGAVTLEAENGNKLTCEASRMGGSFESFTRLKVTLTYSGNCELKSVTPLKIEEGCSTITTKELAVQPGDKLNGGTKAGLSFSPASGEVVAEFTCSGSDKVKGTVKGGFVCESTPIGTPVTKSEIICKQTSAGKQEFTSIVLAGKLTEETLKAESSLSVFKISEKTALSMTESVTWSTPVEQTA